MQSNRKITKQVVSTKPLPAAGAEPQKSALIGGVGNTAKNATKDYGKGG